MWVLSRVCSQGPSWGGEEPATIPCWGAKHPFSLGIFHPSFLKTSQVLWLWVSHHSPERAARRKQPIELCDWRRTGCSGVVTHHGEHRRDSCTNGPARDLREPVMSTASTCRTFHHGRGKQTWGGGEEASPEPRAATSCFAALPGCCVPPTHPGSPSTHGRQLAHPKQHSRARHGALWPQGQAPTPCVTVMATGITQTKGPGDLCPLGSSHFYCSTSIILFCTSTFVLSRSVFFLTRSVLPHWIHVFPQHTHI